MLMAEHDEASGPQLGSCVAVDDVPFNVRHVRVVYYQTSDSFREKN
jgi:hypothetical protein